MLLELFILDKQKNSSMKLVRFLLEDGSYSKCFIIPHFFSKIHIQNKIEILLSLLLCPFKDKINLLKTEGRVALSIFFKTWNQFPSFPSLIIFFYIFADIFSSWIVCFKLYIRQFFKSIIYVTINT